MSLKAFHLIFVSMMTALALGFGIWGFVNQLPWLGLASLGVAGLVVFYGFYFLKKLKKISYL